MAQDGGKVCQPVFTPRKYSWYSFLLEAESIRAIVRSEGLCQWKIPNDTIWNRTSDLPIFFTLRFEFVNNFNKNMKLRLFWMCVCSFKHDTRCNVCPYFSNRAAVDHNDTSQPWSCKREKFVILHCYVYGTAVAQWLRRCATSRKVAGSIPGGVIGIFHWHKILPIALWPWGRLSL